MGPDGRPLPTVRLENFRDGLEDFAYAKLLEQKLQERLERPEHQTSNVEHRREGLQDVQDSSAGEAEWIRRAKAALAVPADVMKSLTQFTGDPATVLRWRDEMADLIEEAGGAGAAAPK